MVKLPLRSLVVALPPMEVTANLPLQIILIMNSWRKEFHTAETEWNGVNLSLAEWLRFSVLPLMVVESQFPESSRFQFWACAALPPPAGRVQEIKRFPES